MILNWLPPTWCLQSRTAVLTGPNTLDQAPYTWESPVSTLFTSETRFVAQFTWSAFNQNWWRIFLYHLKYLESKLPEFISSSWWLWVRHWRHQTKISTKHYIPKIKLFFLMTSSWWSYLDVATKEEFSGNIQIAILDPHQAWLLHWLYGSNYLQWNGSYTIMNIRSRRNLMDKLVVHPSMSDLKLGQTCFFKL